MTFYIASVAEVGFVNATADLVAVTLASPRSAFREEVSIDEGGVLRPAQQLQQITYALADLPPFALGLSINDFSSAEAGLVDTVLAAPEARQKLARFFRAWLEIEEPDLHPERVWNRVVDLRAREPVQRTDLVMCLAGS